MQTVVYNAYMADVTLILDNIRSTHNVGSIFRTADGFGVREIICTGYTPHPSYPGDTRLPHIRDRITHQIHKTALGAEDQIPFRYYPHIADWIADNAASDSPLPLYALEQTPNSIVLHDAKPADRYALLLGEEVHGISTAVLDVCAAVFEIPMQGAKESFNVSVATGIALYGLTYPR